MENERIAKLEVISHENKKDIVELKKDNNLVHKMNVLLEVQIEMNKNQQKQMDGFQTVVNSVNENLTSLNHTQNELKSTVDKIAIRQDEIEEELHEEQDRNKVSSNDVIHNIVKFILFALPAAIIGGFIMKYLGL